MYYNQTPEQTYFSQHVKLSDSSPLQLLLRKKLWRGRSKCRPRIFDAYKPWAAATCIALTKPHQRPSRRSQGFRSIANGYMTKSRHRKSLLESQSPTCRNSSVVNISRRFSLYLSSEVHDIVADLQAPTSNKNPPQLTNQKASVAVRFLSGYPHINLILFIILIWLHSPLVALLTETLLSSFALISWDVRVEVIKSTHMLSSFVDTSTCASMPDTPLPNNATALEWMNLFIKRGKTTLFI